jgi:hypothetical protein
MKRSNKHTNLLCSQITLPENEIRQPTHLDATVTSNRKQIGKRLGPAILAQTNTLRQIQTKHVALTQHVN